MASSALGDRARVVYFAAQSLGSEPRGMGGRESRAYSPMRRLWTRIRAAIGMGLTWAAAWAGGGFVFALGLRLLTSVRGGDVPFPLVFGAFGFIGGVTFSGVLSLLEGRRSFAEMSLPRFAAWGGSAGLLLAGALAATGGSGFLSDLAVLGPVLAAAGAGSAAGSLALAKRADDPEALEAGDSGYD